jgi:predicted ATPase
MGQASAANGTQIILSTQLVPLLDEFDPDDVIVVDRKDGCSEFRRLSGEELGSWLESYSLGELWTKNVIGGKPQK